MLFARLPLHRHVWEEVTWTLESSLADVRFHRYDASFVTYGLPAYQSDHGGAEYRAEARRCSPRLLSAMPQLYKEVVRCLEALFRRPVRFHSELAVPGFHHFAPGALETFHGGNIHSDLSYSRVPWEFQREIPMAHWSVLAVVDAPDGGACLDFYDEFANPATHYFPSGAGFEAKEPASRLVLKRGTLAIFNGYQLHRIGPCEPVTGDKVVRPRVTLQGHLYCMDGESYFYW